MNLAKLLGAFHAYRSGAPLGDVVVLKLDALSSPSPDVARKLEAIRGYAPAQDLAALRALPAGSLGREYARFLDANGITPLVVSAAVRERFSRDPYALRYTATHDLHHVLTGFDTGLAGEAGVLAFNVGQGSAPVSRAMLWLVRLLYMLVSPTQARAIARNVSVGRAMGRSAQLVIASPLESCFEEPLAAVRARLGIPDPREAGVLPSGRSVVARLVLPSGAQGSTEDEAIARGAARP
jgi:ubiquinone biosynthesis protein COQ4